MELGRVGIWTAHLNLVPTSEEQELVAELEELGYGALWLPEAFGKDPFVSAALLLGATGRLVLATGIANIYGRDAVAMSSAQTTLAEAFPDRFLLGLGVSHQPAVEGLRGHSYGPPLATMRTYLDAMDAAPSFAFGCRACHPGVSSRPSARGCSPSRRSGRRARTRTSSRWSTRRWQGRPSARGPCSRRSRWSCSRPTRTPPAPSPAPPWRSTCGLPNYTNNLLRLGFTDDDIADGGSDRLVDAIVAWGDEAAVRARVRAHHDAGADHVCVQVLSGRGEASPVEGWRRLAPALLG